MQPGVIKLLVEADPRYQLTQRERITFALVAQTEGVSAADLAEELELPDAGALRPWLGRLLTWGLVEQSGRTNATRYFVPPALLREARLDALTTLTRVQPHRLRALILEDLERFPDSFSRTSTCVSARRSRTGRSGARSRRSSTAGRCRRRGRRACGSTGWRLSATESTMADSVPAGARETPVTAGDFSRRPAARGRESGRDGGCGAAAADRDLALAHNELCWRPAYPARA